MSAEDITAQLRAAAELDEALEKEEMRLIQEALAAEKAKAEEEARREAEEKAREEAEEAEAARLAAEEKAAEEAEQQARQAEEAARQDALAEKPAATPGLLTSRGKRRPADTAEKNIIPTAAQQEAARALLNKTTPPHPKAVRTPETAEKETPQAKQPEQPQEDVQLPGSVRNGVLRTRRFAPPEEAISNKDEDEPMPNSVEMRGFRSPVMKATLPMNLDGKIIKKD